MATSPTSEKVSAEVTALVQARRAHGIPAYKIAAKLRRTAAWLSQIENGARSPTKEELTAISFAIERLAGKRA